MKAFLGTVVCAVAISGFNAAPAGAALPQAGTAAASDKQLDSRIEQRIHKDPSLKRYDIDVSVADGVATLSGTVATEADRTKATQLATMSGISRVDNRIIVDRASAQKPTGTAGTIKEKTKEGGEKTKEGAEKLGDKTKDGAGKVADKTKEGVSKTGEAITDGWITTR